MITAPRARDNLDVLLGAVLVVSWASGIRNTSKKNKKKKTKKEGGRKEGGAVLVSHIFGGSGVSCAPRHRGSRG